VVMLTGVWLSGVLATKMGAADRSRNTRFMAWASVLLAPLALFVLWTPYKYAALIGYLLLNIPGYIYLAPTAALVQDLVGPTMRATMASVFILVQMLAGGLIGTQVVGLLSDALTPLAGNSTAALCWSMTLGSLTTLWAALHFWWAGRWMRSEGAAGDDISAARPIERVDAPALS